MLWDCKPPPCPPGDIENTPSILKSRILAAGDCECLNLPVRKFLHPRAPPSHLTSYGSTCKHILRKSRWCVLCCTTDHLCINWHLWAEFKPMLKGSAVMLKPDLVILLALPKYKQGKFAVAFLLSENRASKFNAAVCEKSYQQYILYHTFLSMNTN